MLTTMSEPPASVAGAAVPAPATWPHVVAVDDDAAIRALLVDYLSGNELRVSAVASGRELSELLARETVDLVVLDVRLPGEDGMQIARRLREGSGRSRF